MAQIPASPSIEPAPVLVQPTPRYRLARRMLIWTVLLAVGPTFLYAGWVNRMTQRSLQQSHVQHVEVLGQALAAALVSRPDTPLSVSASQVLDVVELDRRLAFVAVADETNTILHRRAVDPDAWASHANWLAAQGDRSAVTVNHTIALGRHRDLVVYQVPIWNSPVDSRRNVDSTRQLVGYVVLALREKRLIQTLSQMRTMQFAVAGLVCALAGTLMAWLVRRWTRPLMALLGATERIGSGASPPTLPHHANDELGLLTDAFNRMARRLMTTRNQLEDANKRLKENNTQLEYKVEQRTFQLRKANQQLAQAVDQLRTMATTDPLTELANRRAFNDAMVRCFADAQRRHEDMACLVIDLDGFKALNDTLGHQSGDELLKRCANALRTVCRKSDLAGRFGGDEFVALLPGANYAVAQDIAGRIRQTFALEVKQMLSNHINAPVVTMSMGLASLKESGAATPEELFRQADQAMYAAKRDGKARLNFHAA